MYPKNKCSAVSARLASVVLATAALRRPDAAACHGHQSACGRRRFLDTVPSRKTSPRLGRSLSFFSTCLVFFFSLSPVTLFVFSSHHEFVYRRRQICLTWNFFISYLSSPTNWIQTLVVLLCTPYPREGPSMASFPHKSQSALLMKKSRIPGTLLSAPFWATPGTKFAKHDGFCLGHTSERCRLNGLRSHL